ncbi:hypothetical protein M413DRAFT_348801 [Hebeloma cylindrosporum]|uniref:C2H2-type domain-containing protein n=1 Tax=Hebeloma cylindrosporum TaxID=76867 RepID=A0A0C3BVM6_HEBCY|nr:hypothetical protein M413DRAFT_348801 [Hebeloma cylindrosporum h7]
METNSFEDYTLDLWDAPWETDLDAFLSGTEYSSCHDPIFQRVFEDRTTSEQPQPHDDGYAPESSMVPPSPPYPSLSRSAPFMQDAEREDSNAQYTHGLASTVQPVPDLTLNDEGSASRAHSSSNPIQAEGLPSKAPAAGLAAVDSALTRDTALQSPTGQYDVHLFPLNSSSMGFDAPLSSTSTELLAGLDSNIADNVPPPPPPSTGQPSLDQSPLNTFIGPSSADFNYERTSSGISGYNHSTPLSTGDPLHQTESPIIPGAQFGWHDHRLEAYPSTTTSSSNNIDPSLFHDNPGPFNLAQQAYPLPYVSSSGNAVASSSRQTLAEIQPDPRYHSYHSRGKVDFSGQRVEDEPENDDALIPDQPLVRRQKKSKEHRQAPYKSVQRSTLRKGTGPPSIVSPNYYPAEAIARFRSCQEMICPVPINGEPCGHQVKTALEMSAHLQSTAHNISKKKKGNANVSLGGVCPFCGRRLTSCMLRHVMGDFYRYVCPVADCGDHFSRSDQLQTHVKHHGFTLPEKEDFAVLLGLVPYL